MRCFCVSIVLALYCLLALPLNAQTLATEGQILFERKCARCHGKDGTKGLLGAKNLQQSQLSDSMLFITISKGRNNMPAWGNRLSATQIQSIVHYLPTLRTLNK